MQSVFSRKIEVLMQTGLASDRMGAVNQLLAAGDLPDMSPVEKCGDCGNYVGGVLCPHQ